MTDIPYGKRIVHESYFQGKIKGTKVEYSIPVLVADKQQTLSEIMKCLELIALKQTHKMTIKIEADPKTHVFKLVTKQYEVIE